MPKLRIANFSCIEEAEFDLKPLTVLIGPQASGKSVISKLLYFFATLQTLQYDIAEGGNSVRLFHAEVAKKFSEWFPPQAWGSGSFEIEYSAGPLDGCVCCKFRGPLHVVNRNAEYVMEHLHPFKGPFRA